MSEERKKDPPEVLSDKGAINISCGFTGCGYDRFPDFTPESSFLFCPYCRGLMDRGHCKNCTYENGLLLCNHKQ